MHYKPLSMIPQILETLVRDGTHILLTDDSTCLKLPADIFSKIGWMLCVGCFSRIYQSENVQFTSYTNVKIFFLYCIHIKMRNVYIYSIFTCIHACIIVSFRPGRCEFYKGRENFMSFFFAMIGQKDSPLIPAIDAR